MSIKSLISVCLLLLALLTGCGSDHEPSKMVGAESFKTSRFDECIVKVELDKQKTLSHEQYNGLSRFIVFEAGLHASRDESYPLYQTDTTRSSSAREYYFFFAALCEDKLKFTDSVIKKYFFSKREYVNVPYEIFSITSEELPEGVGGFRGLWTDR